jgi:uncharacterized UBP type Zn finger protein
MASDDHVELSAPCAHVAQITIHRVARPAPGCEDCLKMGGRWVHLRACLSCGHVGCCDNSPHRHATHHFHQTRHPIIASAEPGETWAWCYEDRRMLE